MQHFPKWIEDFFPADALVTSIFNPEKIKAFLARYFSHHIVETESRYIFKPEQIEFSVVQMQELLCFMKKYHFDGKLHQAIYAPASSMQHYARAAASILWPPSLAFLILNELEVTATLTVAWEIRPNYFPAAWVYFALMPIALLMARNNYYYAICINKISQPELESYKEAIDVLHDTLKSELPNPLLLRFLTQPSFARRLEQEIRMWIAYFIKLAATSAVFLEEFRGWPLHLILIFAFIAGTNEGVDTAYTMVGAIGGEHQNILDFCNTDVPPLKAYHRALLFPHVANFAPIAWAMAKLGPVAWLLVKIRAAYIFTWLLRLSSDNVSGGLYGFYAIISLSALWTSCSFSNFSVDQKLGKELPTQRDFAYEKKFSISALAKALLGALPVAAIPALAAHASGYSNRDAIIISTPVVAATFSLILNAEVFMYFYRWFMEARVADHFFRFIDSRSTNFNAFISLAALIGAAIGAMSNHKIISAIMQPVLFVFGTSLVAQHSRPLASKIRFCTAQTFFYATALFTWILNFVLPLRNLSDEVDPKNHPTQVRQDYFSQAVYFSLVLGGLLASFFAASKDWRATAAKVPSMSYELLGGNSRLMPERQRGSSEVDELISDNCRDSRI